MKLEELETLWISQPSPSADQVSTFDADPRLARELARRSRMFGYRYFFISLGLVVVPLLAFVNFINARPENLMFHVLNTLLVVTVSVLLLIGTIRRHRRHRALLKAKADTLAASAAVSIANLEAELREFRISRWGILLCLAMSMIAIYANHPIPQFGWEPFTKRLGMVVALMLILLSAVSRHQKNLYPELQRRKNLLAQLS